MEEKRKPGRPPGKTYTRGKSLKLRDIDCLRLERLAAVLDRDQSQVIRFAVEELAKAKGLQ